YDNREAIIKSVQANNESLRYGEYGNKENLHRLRRINSFSNLTERNEDAATVDEIVKKSNIRHLSGPFDYIIEDLDSLKKLKSQVLQHLKNIYDVTDTDKIDLYFHTHYSI